MTASDHNASDSKLIRIKTSDEKEFQVEKKVISQCNLIKGILEDLAGKILFCKPTSAALFLY